MSTRTDTLLPDTTLFRSSQSCGKSPPVQGRGASTGSPRCRSRPSRASCHTAARNGQDHRRPLSVSDHSSTSMKTERSEEHTSELQSLMRISYAVFCLKQKIHQSPYDHNSQFIHSE